MSVAEFRRRTSFAPRLALRHGDDRPGLATALLRALKVWRQRTRDRAELSRMGYLALRDLGVPDPDIAWHEARQPFWRNAHAAWREVVAERSLRCRG